MTTPTRNFRGTTLVMEKPSKGGFFGWRFTVGFAVLSLIVLVLISNNEKAVEITNSIPSAAAASVYQEVPNPNGMILHPNSMSIARINAMLESVKSPLLAASWFQNMGAARYIYGTGKALGVDDGVFMAIFWHESHLGTQGIARLTHGPGNIRPLGNQPGLDGYRYYRSWQEGVDDTFRLLKDYAKGGAETVSEALPIWAPPSDNNDTPTYIQDVLSTLKP